MKAINYDVSLIKQGASECLQASITQLLNYLKFSKSLEGVKKEIPVYRNSAGELLGSSIGHMARYLVGLGLKTTMHVVDVEIFDRSWTSLSKSELCENLKERKKYVKHHRYDKETLGYIIDGYIEFLSSGGKIIFPIIDGDYLRKLLEDGPFIALASSNFLHQTSKGLFPTDTNQNSIPDSIKGSTFTHAVVVSGFEGDNFEIVDPLPEKGGKRKISSALLIGSIYLAETDFDPLLITVEK